MLNFTAIQDRVLPFRPDLLERSAQIGFQVAVRRLAEGTYALQETKVLDLAGGVDVASVYTAADEKESLFILKADRNSAGLWVPLESLNRRLLREGTPLIQEAAGTMSAFLSDHGKFRPYQPPLAATQVRLLVAYKPTGDFEDVDLASDFENALVAGTLAYSMALPGTHQDKALAERREHDFIAFIFDHRAMELIGETDYTPYRKRARRLGNGFNKLRW